MRPSITCRGPRDGTRRWRSSDRPLAAGGADTDTSFGVRTNQFGFNILWASGMVVVVEACTDLGNPTWSPVGTNTLTDGTSYSAIPTGPTTRPLSTVSASCPWTTNTSTKPITAQSPSPDTPARGDVTIPSTINELPVTSIGPNAFYMCFSLTNVTIGTGSSASRTMPSSAPACPALRSAAASSASVPGVPMPARA